MEFVNAQEQHKKYPNTFSIPSDEELNNVKVDDFVKVCLNSERFWIKVVNITGDDIIGEVSNCLLFNDLELGEKLTVKKYNILSITN